jgi:hypothetical protein
MKRKGGKRGIFKIGNPSPKFYKNRFGWKACQLLTVIHEIFMIPMNERRENLSY